MIPVRVFIPIQDPVFIAVRQPGVGAQFFFEGVGQSVQISVVQCDDPDVVDGDSRYGMTCQELAGV